MKTTILIAFSALLLLQNSMSQVTVSQMHPTQMAIEKWLEDAQRSGTRSAPQICMVTVDANSTHNIIYWDKTGMGDVDYFKIYRENGGTGAYDSIGVRPYDSLSEYHDFGTDPNLGKSRYKISAVDTLGVESPMSLYHGTIFCDEPTEGDFDWNDYEIEGSPSVVLEFVMLRMDTIGSPWNPIDTVMGSTTNFTDPANAAFPAGDWRVRTIWPITCTSTRAGVSTSRSNIRNKSMLVGMSVATISENNINVSVYPNPATNVINVNFTNASNVILRDASGRIIEQHSNVFNRTQFNLNNLENGVYFVEVGSSFGKTVAKIIKQ